MAKSIGWLPKPRPMPNLTKNAVPKLKPAIKVKPWFMVPRKPLMILAIRLIQRQKPKLKPELRRFVKLLMVTIWKRFHRNQPSYQR